MRKISAEGSVRADLLGGTLDIHPMNLILEDVVTINVATSLKAKVTLEEIREDHVEIHSLDYDKHYTFSPSDFHKDNFSPKLFKEMSLVAHLLLDAGLTSKLKVTLSSGAPAGSGLGGSSSMAVVVRIAIAQYKRELVLPDETLKRVMNIEARVLDCGPTGYQDYYPAYYGGVLGLVPTFSGVDVHQLYSEELKTYLEENFLLVFSGQCRFSAINNWEVYQGFFNKKPEVRKGLQDIASLSRKAFEFLKRGEFQELGPLIVAEGQKRKELFSKIQTDDMTLFEMKLKQLDPSSGIKVCGAGGGGCFLTYLPSKNHGKAQEILSDLQMKDLGFKVVPPRVLT